MINMQTGVPFAKAVELMGRFTANLASSTLALTFEDEECEGRFMAVIVNNEYPGGFGLVMDRKAARFLGQYFAELAKRPQ